MTKKFTLTSRRAFLSFLASSPAFLGARNAMGQLLEEAYAPEAVSRASDAINVFDFHEIAKRALMPGHYTYMALGTDSGGTLRANRAGFDKFQLRMRRLVDVSNVETDGLLHLSPCAQGFAIGRDPTIAVASAAPCAASALPCAVASDPVLANGKSAPSPCHAAAA